jgi:hypothetical protein
MAYLITSEELKTLMEELYEAAQEWDENIIPMLLETFLEGREEYQDPDDPIGVMWAAHMASKEEVKVETQQAAREIEPVGSVTSKVRKYFG